MSSLRQSRTHPRSISDDSIKGTAQAQDVNIREHECSSSTGSISSQPNSTLIDSRTLERLNSKEMGDLRDTDVEAVEISGTKGPLEHDLTQSFTTSLSSNSENKALDSGNSNSNIQSYQPDVLKTQKILQSLSFSAQNDSMQQHCCDETDRSPTRSDSGFNEKASMSEDEKEVNSSSEIKSIMDQFSEAGHGPGQEEIMSPRLEVAGPLVGGSIQHPPRKSSLEPLNTTIQSIQDLNISSTPLSTPANIRPAVPLKSEQDKNILPPCPPDERHSASESSLSQSIHRPPPPEPEPEPDLPFDFHRFLEQLRHKTADPVAKFLRSFLQEFGKKQWMVHEQVKIISDFLAFITKKMASCDVWSQVSDAEFENAREGMEKLVMNRLYTQTFSPAIPPPQPIPGSRPKRRGVERSMGPGRKGQHQEDVERDEILAQKVRIYGWVREKHLDIPPVAESGKRFLVLAQQELLKIKTYRAPRDKIICVLNCCKVIFGFLKHSKSDSSADSFMPLLIYVILQANPEYLVSNVQYILRFRNQEKLAGEAGYYLSSLLGAVQFIENLDRTSLTVSDEEFEKSVETAVSAIAEKHVTQIDDPKSSLQTNSHQSEIAHQSNDSEDIAPSNLNTSNEYEPANAPDEKAAMSGILRTIQRPLSSIGRIFSDELPPASTRTSQINNSERPLRPQISSQSSKNILHTTAGQNTSSGFHTNPENTAAMQASAEAAMAQHIERVEHLNIVETLAVMFPDLDREIIDDVVTQKKGRVGLAVDACLALSS